MEMFVSDNGSGVHKRVLEAIVEENYGHKLPYGNDDTTRKAESLISELFGKETFTYFVTTGTAANVLGISSLLRPFEGVVTARDAHINVEETGSFERITGCKIIAIPSNGGKIKVKDIEDTFWVKGIIHRSQPRVVSITQPTEAGEIYTVEEIREIVDFAHANDLLVHIDGARISNAVVSLNTSFKEMVTDTGVDMISFGGTKNGLMLADAIVSLNADISEYFKYYIKQGMQLISKMRFISCQFIPYIEEELWKENAKHANDMATYLKEELDKVCKVKVMNSVSVNMLFVKMNKDLIDMLHKDFDFYVSNVNEDIVRFVTSFDTTKEEIDRLITCLKNCCK